MALRLNNKKEVVFIITITFIFVFGVDIINQYIEPWVEQEICKIHPEDCECVLTCKEILEKANFVGELDDLDTKFVVGIDTLYEKNLLIPIDKCVEEGMFKLEKCNEWRKKNPCQLKLEKEGVLGEDCVCEEYSDVCAISSVRVPSYCAVNCTDESRNIAYDCDYLDLPECEPEIICDCIKAREKTNYGKSCDDELTRCLKDRDLLYEEGTQKWWDYDSFCVEEYERCPN